MHVAMYTALFSINIVPIEIFCLQNGVIIVLRPDLIDYETNQQFDIVIIAYDLVLPVNQRRQVRWDDSLTLRTTHILFN